MAGSNIIIGEERKKTAAGNPVIGAPQPLMTQEELEAQRAANLAAQATVPAQPVVATAEVQAREAAPVDETRNTIAQGYDQQYQDFYDIAMSKKAEMDAAQQEDINQQQAYQKAAAWAGAGELVTSLANLIGVGGFNSANQQYANSYSRDWMKKADEARRTRQARTANYRAKLDSMNEKLAALKSGKAMALATYDRQKRTQDIQQQKADAYYAYQVARTSSIDAKNAVDQARVALLQAQTARNDEQTKYWNARIKDLEEKQKDADAKLQIAREDLDRKNRLTDSQVGVNNARKARIASKAVSLDDEYSE